MSNPLAAKPALQSIAPFKSQNDILSLISAHDIKYVRIQLVDYINQVRCRVLPVSYFRKLLASERPCVAMVQTVLGMVVLQFASRFSAAGESVYVFDLTSFRTCHYAPRHAVLFGYFQEKMPVLRSGQLTLEVPYCTRSVLARLVKYAAEELGVRFLIGLESEFILLKSTNPVVAVNESQYSTAIGLTTGTVEAKVMEEIADALQADGIELQMYHTEAAPGQYEVVTGPMLPLEAADALVHTRETIYNIASKNGLRATFAPRLSMTSCGTGAHMHVSVHGNGAGLPASPSQYMTPVESAFLSGLMQHLPSVIALLLPLRASYTRMADGVLSGGTWASWGVEQREAPVRLTNVTSATSRNFEVRTIDGTSSPYLSIAGVLACGILGLRDKSPLTVKSCDTAHTAALMSPEEREALGITKRLPLNLDEARQSLASADAIKEILGAPLVDNFGEINEMLEKLYERHDGETEAEALARLIENY